MLSRRVVQARVAAVPSSVGRQGLMLAGEGDRLEDAVRPEADLAGEGGCFRVCA
jgi:hypothetical protein